MSAPRGEQVPPKLPSRPAGRGGAAARPPARPPVESSDESDSGDSGPGEYLQPQEPDEIYDDCSEQEAPDDVYDDCEENLRPPPPQAPEENYDDLDNVGPIVQQFPKKNTSHAPPVLPARPQPPKVEEIVEEVYEDPDASQPDTVRRADPVVITYPKPGSPSPKARSNRSPARSKSPSGFLGTQSASPRQKSPGRLTDRSLPPLPDSRGSPLPPIPPIGSGRPAPPTSPAPVAAARARRQAREQQQQQQGEDSSPAPVVVSLNNRQKQATPRPVLKPGCAGGGGGALLPPPQPQQEETVSSEEEVEDVYEVDEEEDQISVPPPLPARPIEDDVYEVGDGEDNFAPAAPPPPPPPPPHSRPAKDKPPQRSRSPPVTPVPKGLPGGARPQMVIDPNQLKGLRNNLRRVSLESPTSETPEKSAPKQYDELPQSVSEMKKKLQEKADGRPGIGPKPAIASKIAALSKAGENSTATTTNGQEDTKSKRTWGTKPLGGVQDAPAKSSSPDVTFLPKANKDKHTNMPVPPVPSANKPPATKFEPKQAEVQPVESDDIYDDACSNLKHELEIYDWFHGLADRTTAERSIKSVEKDGTFLVRISEKDPNFPYTLVVLHNKHVNNLRIRKRPDGQYALGEEKADELAFPNVPAMINHHKSHNVVLLSGSATSHVILQATPRKY